MVWEVCAAVAMVLTAVVLLPRYLKGGIATVPQFLEARYDKATKSITSGLFLTGYVVVFLPIVLYSGALALNNLFDVPALLGVSKTIALWITVWSIGIIGSIYAIFGGLKAVAVSDTINAIGLLIGGLLIPVFGLLLIGDGHLLEGLTKLADKLPEKFNIIGGSTASVPFGTIFTGMMLVQLFYWGTNQAIVQRALGAKNLAEGQKGLVYAACVKVLIPVIVVLPGIIAFYVFDGHLENPDEAYTELVKKVLPLGLVGFFAAVLFGAILSSFNSALNSSVTLFGLDIYKSYIKKNAKDEQVVKIGKLFGVGLAILSMCVAPLIAKVPGGLFGYLQEANGCYSIPILTIVVVGVNLIGEHTDYNNGFVFPAAIDKGICLGIAPSKSEKSGVFAVDLKDHFEFDTATAQKTHPNKTWVNYILGIVEELRKKDITLPNFSVCFSGDIPLGAGLSSSAALENAFVFALNHQFSLGLSPFEMVKISQKAEHHFVGVQCGIMDQYVSMFGIKDAALLLDCDTLQSQTYPIDLEDFEWLLVNTNVKHSLNASAYNQRRASCERVANTLQKKSLRQASFALLEAHQKNIDAGDYQKACFVLAENQRVQKAKEAFQDKDVAQLGNLLYASHQGLSEDYERFNILTGEWVLVSPHRTKRPWQGQVEKTAKEVRLSYDPDCYLCKGNKRANGDVNPDYESTFVFTNDFAALQNEGVTLEKQANGLLVSSTEKGICKVVCFSPDHSKTLADMEVSNIAKVVKVWQEEYQKLGAIDFINYVQIFENKGVVMGCSNPHPHGQIWAQSSVPNEVLKKDKQQKQYHQEKNTSLLQDYTLQELQLNERVVYENEGFVVLVPYWAVWPYETMIIPKKHHPSIESLSDEEACFFADAIAKITKAYDKVFDCLFPYSSGIHQAPTGVAKNDHWHFHMSFYPPLLRSASVKKFMVGYEMFGMPQRDITAEAAAKTLLALMD
uniref:Galactose-1-phosphate uridylyltransferase n=1 Tax=Stylophora pistillata TaxID=50429 RepID=A0A2B4S082_STYPI